jgi:prepilin-type N-terminal cleavage/methylation domain-containing protein
MRIKNNKGITLVEVIVVSLLIAVLAGAGLPLFLMYTRETGESATMLELQFQLESVLEEMARRTRHAAYVIIPAEPLPLANCGGALDVNAQEVQMHTLGAAIGLTVQEAGFRFVNGTLEEWVQGNWVPFTIGARRVFVDQNVSNFILSGCRNTLEVDITVTRIVGNIAYRLQARGGSFLCRNGIF